MAGWLAGWLVGWLAGLAGWLVGWLAGLGSLVSIKIMCFIEQILRIGSKCKSMNTKASAKTRRTHVALASSVIIRGAMSKNCMVM